MNTRRARIACSTAMLVLAGTSAAHAQHHHAQPGGEDHMSSMAPRIHVHAGLHLEMGTVEAFGADRTYQGLAVMLGASRDRLELALHVPVYRIELGAATGTGLGDIHAVARYVVFRGERVSLGASAGLMPPFGDDDDGIGMGHWMVMAGGFARATLGRISGELSLGYGGALASAGHAEHGVDVWPPVAPMNAQEIRATAVGTVRLWKNLGVAIEVLGATPLGDGAFIASAGGELTVQLGRMRIGAGARHGLASHTAGLVVSSSLMGAF